jgi:predicted amidophosphoribosyltransferase
MKGIPCSNCQYVNVEDAKFCDSCGTKLEMHENEQLLSTISPQLHQSSTTVIDAHGSSGNIAVGSGSNAISITGDSIESLEINKNGIKLSTAPTRVCPQCKKPFAAEDNFCRSCGQKLS